MAALVCDLCGGKLIMGAGGIATCDSCGMEYSVDRMKEKVQEVKGVVQVDSAHLIGNFLRMAQNAYASNNKAEAESYCNKIIETEPTNQQAWLLKGKAAGWQSSLSNIRFSEAINCFANAIEYTQEDEKEAVINECKQEVKELAEALLRLRGERFAKWPDEEEQIGFINDLTTVLKATLQFFETVGFLIDKDELMAPLAAVINDSVVDAWCNVVRPTFANDHDGHPDDYELKKLVQRAGYCTDLLEQAISLCDSDEAGDIQRYKNLIAIHEYLVDAQSYSYETVSVGNSWVDGRTLYENQYVKSKTLDDEAKRKRRHLISIYKEKIKYRKREGFWRNYLNEYKFLVEELEKSKTERDKLKKAQTGHTKIEQLNKHISEIESIIKKDRELDSKLAQSEKNAIENSKTFWEKLSSDDGGYDAYLDQNPILKKAAGLAVKRNELLQRKKAIEGRGAHIEAWKVIVIILALAVGVFSLIVGYQVEEGFCVFMGWVCLILGGGYGYYTGKEFIEDEASKSLAKEECEKEIREYNKTIDKMLAVPKYEGSVDRDQEVRIPEKIV